MRRAAVHRLPMPDPGDASALAAAIEGGAIDPAEIVAILGKTPGNGLTNDHTREYAAATVAATLARKLGLGSSELRQRILLLFSGGTEGALAPHLLVFCRGDAGPTGPRLGGLAIGLARSRPLLPEEIGREKQIEASALAVDAAMRDAGLDDPAEIRFVVAKTPIPRPGDLHAAPTGSLADTSMPGLKRCSRIATSLGAARALGEIAPSEATMSLADGPGSRRLCATAAVDSASVEALVLGMSKKWAAGYAIGSGVMRDLLDAPALVAILESLGLRARPQLDAAERARLIGVIVKGDPPGDDRLREARHVMLDDSDIHPVRHYRAFLGGVIGAVTGDTHVYLSGGAERQAPPGGAVVAMIVRNA